MAFQTHLTSVDHQRMFAPFSSHTKYKSKWKTTTANIIKILLKTVHAYKNQTCKGKYFVCFLIVSQSPRIFFFAKYPRLLVPVKVWHSNPLRPHPHQAWLHLKWAKWSRNRVRKEPQHSRNRTRVRRPGVRSTHLTSADLHPPHSGQEKRENLIHYVYTFTSVLDHTFILA